MGKLSDKLAYIAPPSVVRPGSVITDTISDLERILKLPRRPPVVCEIDPLTGQYPLATIALIEHETAKFSRGRRISCACRPRKVLLDWAGNLTIFRVLPEDMPPEPPILTTRAAFLADNQAPGDDVTMRAVRAMLPGTELALSAASEDNGGIGHDCIEMLNAPQAWFLREAAQIGGAIGMLGVGSGKSICFLLAPLLFADSRLAVLLIEPKQRHHYKSEYLRLREHFRVSSITCDLDIPGSTVPGTTPLHLVSYSILSRTDNSDMLDVLKPDSLFLDECFPSRTEVLTNHGWLRIGDIVNQQLRVSVFTRSAIGYLEWQPIVRWLRRATPQRLVRVVHEHGAFVCTPNHKIWTTANEYVVAEALTCEDRLQVRQDVRDGNTRSSRVVRVEVLERGSDGRFERHLGEDQAVYDLEVAVNHNYFADGVLVSNCHRACGQSAINLRVKRYATACILAREAAIARGEAVRTRALRLLNGSGTMESKSVNDTQMLCAYSLGTGSPLPLDPNEAAAWSNVIDASRRPDRESLIARQLHKAFGNGIIQDDNDAMGIVLGDDNTPERALQRGFQKWRSETPGIVAASATDINAAIYVSEFKVPKLPASVKDALMRVRVDNLRPDGEKLEEKIEQIACAKNVGCGFYPYWKFPKHPCTKSEHVGEGRCGQCRLIDNWYAARKLYSKEERSRLLRGEVHLDSPENLRRAAIRAWAGPVCTIEGAYCDTCLRSSPSKEVEWPCPEKNHMPAWRCEAWPAWAEIENQVEYEECVTWIGHGTSEADDPATHPGYFLARAAAEWARKNPCVLWVESTPLGQKIAELSGLPFYNGGPGAEQRLRAENGKRSIICSVSAHGAGTNCLQFVFADMVVLEPSPSNASSHGAEQVFARLHRRGQKKDVVNVQVAVHIYEFMDAMRKAIQQAAWNFAMLKLQQKLRLADIDIDDL